MIEDISIKVKEFGKPVFKAKGTKSKVKEEMEDFWRMKV
jgi:hypothetical protein